MIPVLDGHNDAALRVWRSGGSLRERSADGHLDVPRMREGGIACGFFALFVPAQDEEPPDPRARVVATAGGYEVPQEGPLPFERAARVADELAAIVERDLPVLRTVAGVEACLASGGATAASAGSEAAGARPEERPPAAAAGAILHLEGAEPIAPNLSNLGAWHERGLRSLGLVWSRPNAFGHGVPFRFPGGPDTGPGLTRAGRQLVTTCNELGIVVDLAHLNERGFRDVAALSDAPLVVSHAGMHALCPIPRGVTDEQLDAIRDSDGVVGIVFDTPMTRADADLRPDTPLETIAAHVDYVAERIGVEHVALGSDFDGGTPPHALADASRTQALLDALEWSAGEKRALAHGNWLRVLRQTWRD